MLFECPRYPHIRVRYEQSLFTAFGGISHQTPRSMIIQGKMSAFMNQDPKQITNYKLAPIRGARNGANLGSMGTQINTHPNHQ